MTAQETQDLKWSIEAAVKDESTFTTDYLLPWASSLPSDASDNKVKVLDLAGGAGRESQELAANGYTPVLIDLSSQLLGVSSIPQAAQAEISQIPLANETIAGVLLKDVWIFLNNENRKKVLREIFRVLQPGGSVLIFSQNGDKIRVHYKPNSSSYPQKETFENSQQMQEALDQGVFNDAVVISTEYLASAESTVKLATEMGWEAQIVEDFKAKHQLATENKWINKPGFIVKLKKP